MPKTKKQKQETVGSLVENFKKAKAAVFANFQGLTVAAFEELRKIARKENVGVVATKKTLIKRALEEAGIGGTDPKAFSGGVGVFVGYGDEVGPAKVVHAFAKDHETVAIHGGILEGKFIDPAEVKFLASLPGRIELLSRMVGTLNAPISGFVNVLAGNLRGLVSVLNNIKEAKGKV